MKLRRVWNYALKGYTYDGVHLTECQCCTSGGGCRCGRLPNDQAKELARREGLRAALAGESGAETVPETQSEVPGSNLDSAKHVSRCRLRRVVSQVQAEARLQEPPRSVRGT